jgi:predicted porin
MKKSLLALAVLGAFTGAAYAQSSVTLFGIVDQSVNYVKNGGTHTTTLASNQLNSNRLGFRGVEDLGGGLKAGFWLEAGMDNGTGVAGGASGNVAAGDGTSSQLFNRRSTVSLMGNFGELRLGRDYTASFWNTVFDDVNGANGIGNSLTVMSTLGSGAQTLVRANNVVAYFLPGGLGGFYGQVQAALGQGNDNNKYTGARFGYGAGPMDVNIGYGQTKTVGSDFKMFNVGGSYDFGVAKVFALYNQNKYASLKQDLYELGAGVPVGPGQFRAAYSHSKITGGATDPKADLMWVEYIYDLSKRTSVYTTYAHIKNDGGAAYTVLSGTAGSALNDKSDGFNVGIRHSF